MKVSLAVIGISLLMIVSLGDVSAKRNRGGNRNKQGKNRGCSEWSYGECVPKQGNCGKGKKQGTRTGDDCEQKEKQFRCMIPCPDEEEDMDGGDPRCPPRKYNKGEREECDISTNLQNVTFTLKDASNTDCPATLVKSLECRRVDNNGRKMKRACKFTKGEWSDCDATSGQRTRVDTLKKAKNRAREEGGCAETRTLTAPCLFSERRLKRLAANNKCSEWNLGECVPNQGSCGKGKRTGTRTGDNCRVTEKEFRCKIPCRSGDKCKPKLYTKGSWSECDDATSLKTMTLTLRDDANATSCPATKEKTKKCRPLAGDATCPTRFYDKGEWSECDPSTFLKTLTLTLKAGSNANCPATKAKSKKCKLLDENGRKMKSACKYAKGEWSECNQTTGMRTRVDTLVKAKGGQFCTDTRTLSKPCKQQ